MNAQDLMGFNPNEVDVFATPANNANKNNAIDDKTYKTNPSKYAKSDDGIYRSRIRLLYNPFAEDVKRDSIVNRLQYVLRDEQGLFFVTSALGDGDKSCPIFKGWKQLWFKGADGSVERAEAREQAKKYFERNESRFVLAQVIEDDNQPELVGKFVGFKLPKHIAELLEARMRPTDGKRAPQPLMDPCLGACLELVIQPGPDDKNAPERKSREISYTLSAFESEVTPIIACDGTPLFGDDEIDSINEYASLKTKAFKAKTDDERNAINARIKNECLGTMKELYAKALEYMKANAFDVRAEYGYKPWSEERTARVDRFIANVVAGNDPTAVGGMIFESTPASPTTNASATNVDPITPASTSANDDPFDDGLPF